MRLGAAVRAARLRRRLRQRDLAALAGVSQSTVSRIERGHIGSLSMDTVAAVCEAISVRVDLVPRWRGGDLDRLLNARHAALHDSAARWFARRHRAWVLAPEVSFSIYGERGVIDVLGWHPIRRALLVIELKTEIVDVNELIGTLDRKRRLAPVVARDRGWDAATVSAWVVVARSRTNRRRIDGHAALLRNAFPSDAREMRGWLRDPVGSCAAVSLESFGAGSRGATSAKRVRFAVTPDQPGTPTATHAA